MNSKYTGRGEHPCHHHDDLRRGDHAPEPDDASAAARTTPPSPASPARPPRSISAKPASTSFAAILSSSPSSPASSPSSPLPFETFLPNPGDYSFLYTGDARNLTTKWWMTSENITENGMYGQKGILYNETIWHAFHGTILVSVCCALLAGTIGTMIGYAVLQNRRSRWANYVNAVAFLPYLMPSIAVGVAFFVSSSPMELTSSTPTRCSSSSARSNISRLPAAARSTPCSSSPARSKRPPSFRIFPGSSG